MARFKNIARMVLATVMLMLTPAAGNLGADAPAPVSGGCEEAYDAAVNQCQTDFVACASRIGPGYCYPGYAACRATAAAILGYCRAWPGM